MKAHSRFIKVQIILIQQWHWLQLPFKKEDCDFLRIHPQGLFKFINGVKLLRYNNWDAKELEAIGSAIILLQHVFDRC